MALTKVGILSDTHLTRPNHLFREFVDACFSDIPIILHAGDLTDISILESFAGKEIHAVHGNMCNPSSRSTLPSKKVITLGGFRIGITHGLGYSYNPEDYLVNEFDTVDCIVYGHTHIPVCHKTGDVLFINPGSFTATSRYGSPGSYAILEIGKNLSGTLCEVPCL